MCQMCINLGAFHRILDSSDVVMSKNQKKRARKKLKKAEEVTGESACGAGRETGEGVRVCAEEKPAVRDPVAELKLKLSEAKANQVTHTRVCTCKHTCSLCLSLSLSHTHTHTHTHTQDHEAAQQLREELWTVRDEGPPRCGLWYTYIPIHTCKI